MDKGEFPMDTDKLQRLVDFFKTRPPTESLLSVGELRWLVSAAKKAKLLEVDNEVLRQNREDWHREYERLDDEHQKLRTAAKRVVRSAHPSPTLTFADEVKSELIADLRTVLGEEDSNG